MVNFVYIPHAEESIESRKLEKKVVEDVVKLPEKIINTGFNRKVAQKLCGKKLLRVVYEKKGNVYIIITAYYTKPERYR